MGGQRQRQTLGPSAHSTAQNFSSGTGDLSLSPTLPDPYCTTAHLQRRCNVRGRRMRRARAMKMVKEAKWKNGENGKTSCRRPQRGSDNPSAQAAADGDYSREHHPPDWPSKVPMGPGAIPGGDLQGVREKVRGCGSSCEVRATGSGQRARCPC